MRLIFPLVVLMIALAGCAGEVASPAKPAEKPMQVQSATPENPRADLVPGVNVEQPRTETPAAASRTVSYIVEGMH